MADDRASSTTEPEAEEEVEEKDEEQENGGSSDADGNGDANKAQEEANSGYFSRMLHKTIGGDDLERRIEMLDKEEESLESRMIIRERTAEQVNRSMLFLSLNLEFVAGIYAYLRIRSTNLNWKERAIRIFPMFIIPAIASFFHSLFSRFTSLLNLRDNRLLERLKKEREAKIEDLKKRAIYYMAKKHIQNCNGDSSSMTSSSGSNLPESSDTKDRIVDPNLSRGKSKQFDPEISTDLDSFRTVVSDEIGKKNLTNLVICSTCRMHNGFASRNELPFVSYKCPHCNTLNGPEKEQKDCDMASTSGEGPRPSQPYNPFSTQEMPRGILIEEITPNHEITVPEMDPPVMIIRESPSTCGGEELPSASSPDAVTSVTLRKLPTGLFIEEMTANQDTSDTEMEPPVMTIPESPATVTLLREMTSGLSIEEISPNHYQIENHEVIPPVMIVQESPSVVGEEELPSGLSSAAVTPVPVPEIPSGLSIEEMTPNQEMAELDTKLPVIIIQESPSAGAPVMGDSASVTPVTAQEIASCLSIEEVSPNHEQIEDHVLDDSVMLVHKSPSFDGHDLSVSAPDPAPVTSLTVPEMPGGLSIEELSPNHQGNEDCERDPPVMIIQESPSVGVPACVTPLEVPELPDDTINSDGNVRSPNNSISWSTPGSSTNTGSSVAFQDIPESGQEEINDHDVLGSSDNESLARYLHANADVPHGSVTATAVTGQESLTESHLPSENESGADDSSGGNYESDSNSWRSVGSDPVARSTVTVAQMDPEMGEKLPSESQRMKVQEMNIKHPDTDLNLPYSESETDSDYGSLTDVNEDAETQDPETGVTDGGVVAGSSVTIPEQNSRNAEEEQNDLFTSAYDDSSSTSNDFRSFSWTSGVSRSSVVSGDQEQWSEWQQADQHQSGPTSEKKISDSLNLTTTGLTPVEKTRVIVGEMPPNDAREEVDGMEDVQQGEAESSVSGNSDAAGESLAGSEDYTCHDDPNDAGSVACDRDKGSASQNSRKKVGGTKKDGVLEDKKRQEGRVKEDISEKQGSFKKQVSFHGTKLEPVVKASSALPSPNPGLDPDYKPLTRSVSNSGPQWGPGTDFEQPRSVGLRHRK